MSYDMIDVFCVLKCVDLQFYAMQRSGLVWFWPCPPGCGYVCHAFWLQTAAKIDLIFEIKYL